MKFVHILSLFLGLVFEGSCLQLGVRAPLKNSTLFSSEFYSLDLVARASESGCTTNGPACGPNNCCQGENCCLDHGCCPTSTSCCAFACAPAGWKCCDNGFAAPSGGECCDNGYACLGGSHCVECEDGSGLHCCSPAQSSTLHIARLSSIPSVLLSSIEAKLSRSASGSVAPASASTTPSSGSVSSATPSSVVPSGGASSAVGGSSSFTPFSNSASGQPKRFYTEYSFTYALPSTTVTTVTELIITADGLGAAQTSFSMLEAGINQRVSSLEASVSAAANTPTTPTSSPAAPTSASASASSASVSPNGVSGRLSGAESGSMWLLITAGLGAGMLAIAL